MTIFEKPSQVSKLKRIFLFILFIIMFYYLFPTNYKVFVIDPDVSNENRIRIGYSNQVITIMSKNWKNNSKEKDIVAFLDKSSLHIVPTYEQQCVKIFVRGWFIRFSKIEKIRSNNINNVTIYYNANNQYNNIEYYPIT